MPDDVDRLSVHRAAYRLACALEATAIPLARISDPVPTDAPEPEQMDLLAVLAMLRTDIAALVMDMMSRATVDSGRWALLADVLAKASELCREQTDTGPRMGDLTDDERLAASIALFAFQLNLVAHEVRVGAFDQAHRNELADTFNDLGNKLRCSNNLGGRWS